MMKYNMKHISKIILTASCLVFSASCADSFFDKTPQGSLDASKVDEAFAKSLTNSVYEYLGANMSGYSAPFMDGYADNGYSRNAWDSNGSSVQANTLDASQDYGYEWGYQGVRRCNLALEKFNGFKSMSEGERNKCSAEARVIRAWLYMDLTLRFGDVPLITSMANDYPEGVARTPAKDVRAFVLKELTEAAGLLPETNDKGHLDRTQTYAIKARAAYWFGNYKEAEDASKYVIDKGTYHLHKIATLTDDMKKDGEFFAKMVDFNAMGLDKDAFIKGIFNYQSIWKQDNSSETIIAKEFLPTAEKGSWQRVTCLQSPNMVGKQAWATIVPIQELVDAYWTSKGEVFTDTKTKDQRVADFKALTDEIEAEKKSTQKSFSEVVGAKIDEVINKPFLSEYKNRDARFYASVVFPFSAINKYRANEYQVYLADVVNYGRSGYVFRKMSGNDEVLSVWGDNYYVTGVDFPIIRLAEMYLIFAEAHTQNKGYDAEVTAKLNELRARVGMPKVKDGLAKGEALDFIRAERRIELAGEGLRFFDIRLYEDDSRNGGYKGKQAASVVMKGQIYDMANNPGAKLTWDNRLMLLPLPTKAMDRNKAITANNAGY